MTYLVDAFIKYSSDILKHILLNPSPIGLRSRYARSSEKTRHANVMLGVEHPVMLKQICLK